MSAIVPDGIVAFFTSYVYMENIVASWYEQVCNTHTHMIHTYIHKHTHTHIHNKEKTKQVDVCV